MKKIALLLLLLCSCYQSPSSLKKVLRINLEHDVQTIDPRRVSDLNAMNLSRSLFEGLTRKDQKGEISNGLAEEICISEDGKLFTFRLKKTFWSNRNPVTAHDFVYAWKQCLSPAFCCDTAFQMYVIKGSKAAKEGKSPLEEVAIRALDADTLQVELEKPVPYFLGLLASPPFFPVDHKLDLENPRWAENIAEFVGNGPFLLKKWAHNNCIEIAKNPLYWDSEHMRLSGISFVMVPAETELMMFEKGELDWVGSPFSSLPLEAVQSWKKESSLRSQEMLGTYFLRLNTQILQSPLIRQALSSAIDRQSIVDHILQGGQIPALNLVPPALGLPKREQEEVLCRQEESCKMTLIYPAREKNKLIAQVLQAQWQKTLGIQVDLEPLESKVYYDRLSKRDYQLAIGSWIADFEDPINFLEIFKYKNGGSNNTFWENPEYTSLLDQAVSALDPLQRKGLLARSEAILIEEMPIIPLFHYTMLYSHCPEIKNVVLSDLGQIDFRWSYFEGEDL
ncbi:MAG: peptide ABC transporter substrate-binding protein [Chlamydiales bacterium]|nr:peptide ABC transporter substrate-binding protein [Chlamydiales bacterium]